MLTAAAQPATAHSGGRGAVTTDFTLTILHANDGESQLLGAPADANYGGVARFTTLVEKLRKAEKRPAAARQGESRTNRGVVTLSSGDNFLAGPQFAASLDRGVPFYDSIAVGHIGYDALALGNHEFDFGPDVLADFVSGVPGKPPFLSANLDVGPEPSLAELERRGRIAPATVVKEHGERIGVVGAVTPDLASLSSPRNVVIGEVRDAVQGQVDKLTRKGIDKIILVSHLQDIQEERALVPQLRNVDVVIGGGGGELLATPDAPLVPGDTVTTDPTTGEPLAYPLYAKDAGGATVPIVTTNGDYKYVGRLVVNFDKKGRVLSVADRSDPVRVSGLAPDAVAPDRKVQRTVVEPVAAYVEGLEANVVATSDAPLEGRRDPGVRTVETNLGNLLADALLDAGRDQAAEYGVAPPQVALQNSGGIRNNSLIPAGGVTELDTYSIAPFSNFVAVVPDVPRAQLKELLENAVSSSPAADGRFAQVAGLRFEYDVARTAQQVTDEGTVTRAGERVRDVVLDDGTVLVMDGAVVEGAGIPVVTNDFSARGGDQYPFRGLPFTSVGLTYQQALLGYLTDDLAGRVTAVDYPEGGSGRIVRLG
ncbi:multifunctional 2',3'-cyclic-nucleotide 2'-phosphodiesterase/5'-nucleotidase/3'-nucleotidase [Nocardiopsis ansamitocini]|uniref:Multifunctional 2',3'-cyclic-nucleotide 2'-phosphodiesterase/5'-nucleotidase/3'-nucleotidase n=1 Tax=Nocardiopsis ansamitocini TaxID=1670832 RepID=A0A9W6P5V5_9ACTN|nr:multifunctional 2',3'-cyclic-nucleotide 2'-phosphodiesterase/5'-nucleotidase/3'-nucleotidase [Nocardiopsis ansamitocini]